jgi:hypothetical protein
MAMRVNDSSRRSFLIELADDAFEKLPYEPRPSVTRLNIDGSIQDH